MVMTKSTAGVSAGQVRKGKYSRVRGTLQDHAGPAQSAGHGANRRRVVSCHSPLHNRDTLTQSYNPFTHYRASGGNAGQSKYSEYPPVMKTNADPALGVQAPKGEPTFM